ncbi:MAG: MmcQ/YjbR family DNA-binding protein [Nocardioidaceae bacterium]|nr:MmcQ/YjbR family DNA-binding protein [Nocardioidaceae bacterium]
MPQRPHVPPAMIERLDAFLSVLPQCTQEDAWVGVRWRIGPSTVAHVFGGEDQLFRITFRAEPEEVMAFQHLGGPYFRAEWGANVVGMVLDDDTDWQELGELLTDSYCLQAPQHLADLVERPGPQQTSR